MSPFDGKIFNVVLRLLNCPIIAFFVGEAALTNARSTKWGCRLLISENLIYDLLERNNKYLHAVVFQRHTTYGNNIYDLKLPCKIDVSVYQQFTD